MKSLMFRPEIWQAKLKVLETHGIAVTRRLDGLKEINQEPDAGWRLNCVGGSWYASLPTGYQTAIKPRYQVGDIVYIKEAWFVGKQYDALSPSGLWHHPPVGFMSPYSEIAEREYGRVRNPLHLPEWAARYFIEILGVRPELFRFKDMTTEELELEGGEAAVELLKERYDGNWVWRYQFGEKK